MSLSSLLWDLECKYFSIYDVFVYFRVYICVCFYVCLCGYYGVSLLRSLFFEEKWLYNATKANIVNSLVYIISAVASPFLGFAVDQTGFNVMWGE